MKCVPSFRNVLIFFSLQLSRLTAVQKNGKFVNTRALVGVVSYSSSSSAARCLTHNWRHRVTDISSSPPFFPSSLSCAFRFFLLHTHIFSLCPALIPACEECFCSLRRTIGACEFWKRRSISTWYENCVLCCWCLRAMRNSRRRKRKKALEGFCMNSKPMLCESGWKREKKGRQDRNFWIDRNDLRNSHWTFLFPCNIAVHKLWELNVQIIEAWNYSHILKSISWLFQPPLSRSCISWWINIENARYFHHSEHNSTLPRQLQTATQCIHFAYQLKLIFSRSLLLFLLSSSTLVRYDSIFMSVGLQVKSSGISEERTANISLSRSTATDNLESLCVSAFIHEIAAKQAFARISLCTGLIGDDLIVLLNFIHLTSFDELSGLLSFIANAIQIQLTSTMSPRVFVLQYRLFQLSDMNQL